VTHALFVIRRRLAPRATATLRCPPTRKPR
jgi:hypothetical protein